MVKKFAEPEGLANFLVNQIVFLAGEARKRRSCAYDVATLGYNLKNINLWSRIAQNCLFHSLQSFNVSLFC